MSSKRNKESDEDDFEKDFRASSKNATNKKAKKSETPQKNELLKDSSSRSRRKTADPEELFKKEMEKAIALSLSESTSSGSEKSSEKGKSSPIDKDKKKREKSESTEIERKKDTPVRKEQTKSSDQNPKAKEPKSDHLNDDEDDFIVKPKKKTSKTNLKDSVKEDKIINYDNKNNSDKDQEELKEQVNEKCESSKSKINKKNDSSQSQSKEKYLEEPNESEDEDYSDDGEASNDLSANDDDDGDDFKPKSKKKQSSNCKSKSSKKNGEQRKDSKIIPDGNNKVKVATSKNINHNEASIESSLKMVDITSKKEIENKKNNDFPAKIIQLPKDEVKPVFKSSENNLNPTSSDKKQPFTTASSILNKQPSMSNSSSATASSSFFPKIDLKSTPSNVRVGLSRNSKVKPLHPNVKPI